MSSTPPEPNVPPGYQPGDYVPFADRDPNNPLPIAGLAGPGDQAVGQPVQPARPLTPEEHYRAIYGYDATPRIQLAGWGRRVLAYLFDVFLAGVVCVPLYVGYYQVISNLETTTGADGEQTLTSTGDLPATAVPLMIIGGLIYFAFYVYNWCIRQGRTGYTFGKAVVGIKLVGERSGLPVGAGMSFVRQLAHIVDGLVCYLGYLWPLWDTKKQTFADKIMGTLVIVQPQDQPQTRPATEPSRRARRDARHWAACRRSSSPARPPVSAPRWRVSSPPAATTWRSAPAAPTGSRS